MVECGGMRDRIQFRSFLWFTSLRLLLIFWDLLEILDHKTVKNFIGNKQVRDLFSEASRKVVISDGHEQPFSVNYSVFDSSNIPLQGTVEVLSFIKECIFSPD